MDATKMAYCSLDSKENKKHISGSVNAAMRTCLKVIEKLLRSYFEFLGKEDHLHARSVSTMVMKRIGRPG